MSIARIAVAIALLACLPLAGCKHGAAVESAAASFAGTYAGTLPCADCPGIDAPLAQLFDGGVEHVLGEVGGDAAHVLGEAAHDVGEGGHAGVDAGSVYLGEVAHG